MQPALLHQTDLFRPHNDPDDHWDLACAFAIAKRGWVSLSGILIDHPPGPPVLNHASDPDVTAVAQLSHLTGVYPLVAVGTPEYFSTRGGFESTPAPVGVEFVLRLLRESPSPVAISVVGSARDIAEAIARDPNLFAQKCARIYLVAGSGSPDPAVVEALEWNVALDPAAYAQIFRAKCPVYWLPCLEDENKHASLESRPYAGHFRFMQGDVLDALPGGLRSFFGYMYEKRDSSFWLHALREDFRDVLESKRSQYRMMYSTPLFFDVAGLCVTTHGVVRPKTDVRDDWVYRFEPVKIECSPEGVTRWTPHAGGTDRFLFHVLDTDAYPAAMTRAMTGLLVDAFDPASGGKTE